MGATKNKLFAIAALALLLLSLLCPMFPNIAYAEESKVTYSGVLDDLKKDNSFDESFYPVVADDYSLQMIQIAESVNGELFLYVYQPSGQAKNLKASSINISTTVNDTISFRNYKVQLLNSSGVFYKYVVTNFKVLSEPTRYYAISSIYRPFDETIDKDAEHDNTVTEVNYAVNKQYCFSMINGKPFCNVVDIETIVVTDKFVGFVRYMDGFKLYVGACDSHFVAFNTDKPIDKLLEADVYYTTQKYSYSFVTFVGERHTYGDKSDEYAYLKYTDKVEHSGGGLWAGTYKWDRIETVEQFIAENDLMQNVYSGAIIDVNVANKITDEGKAALKGKKWVLRFAETSYTLNSGQGSVTSFSTLVGDVTILRLKFETDGVTYNLGVIDNKQTGSDKPSNEEEIKPEINKRGKWILIALALRRCPTTHGILGQYYLTKKRRKSKTMNEPQLLSERQQRKRRRALLKRLNKSYTAAHAAWVAMNYYDFYFDERIAEKLGMTKEQFEQFQKNVINALSQYCKIRQERILELINSDTL